MLRPALLLALLAALTAAPTAALPGNGAVFPPAPDGTISFNLPSGNIGCTFIPAGGTPVYRTANGREELQCSRVAPRYLVVVMEDHLGGHQPLESGEVPGLPAAPVLPYGRFWQAGACTCLAARAGLVCTNGSGAGLRMARAEVVTW